MTDNPKPPRRPRPTKDERLLEAPNPAAPGYYTETEPWRILRIMGEFVEGFDELADVPRAVAFFGSSRMQRIGGARCLTIAQRPIADR